MDAATSDVYTLSLHDALPIWFCHRKLVHTAFGRPARTHRDWPNDLPALRWSDIVLRSEEHTSELQSHVNLVCRLLLEKKNHRGSRRRNLRRNGSKVKETRHVR